MTLLIREKFSTALIGSEIIQADEIVGPGPLKVGPGPKTNKEITWSTLSVYNQDDEFIPIFSDYTLLLQFIRHKTEEGKVEILLNKLVDYVKQTYLLISHLLFPAMA